MEITGPSRARRVDVRRPVDAETQRAMLRHMLMARGIDEEAGLLENQGALDLWLSCRGQEAAQVGSAMAIGDEAVIFPSYREHAVAVVRGIDAVSLVAQWAGRTFCGWNPRLHRFFPYTLVLAAQALHGVGYAIGKRLQNMAETVVVYVGDGATSEGDMSEALNLAAVESAQVLFICQNNGWAISKPSHEQMLASIADRANGFGVRSWSISADDPDSTYLVVSKRGATSRRLSRPASSSCGPHASGGTRQPIPMPPTASPTNWPRRSRMIPSMKYRETLAGAGVVDDEWLVAVDADVAAARQELLKAFAS